MSLEKTPHQQREGIVGFALNNPYFIVVACLMITIMGVLAVAKLPKDLLPAANMPAVQILSFYSGMPVEHVEKNLSSRFERYTGQAIGIERQESKSLVGVSIVKNFFGSDTDLNTAISQTTSLVMSVLRRLPPGTQPPLILPFDPMATTPLALVAVSGDLPEKKLYDLGRYDVRSVIQAVPGAMAPTVMGGSERQIVVYLDPKKLKEYHFSALDVLDQVSHLNTFIPTGDIKINDLDKPIVSNGLVEKIDDMNDFPIRSDNGLPIYLKQVGETKDASKIQTNVVMIDGKRQVYVPIFRQPGANSIRVIDEAKAALSKLQTRLKDIKLTLVADQSSFIRHAIESIAEETLIGGGLAVLLVLLFLGNPRASLGLMLTIPLSLLISFLGLQATGQTLNAMTLGGLALAIGVLVDNSIVVLENISNKIEGGMSPSEAAYHGTTEVAMPVLASTLATLVVLFPVVFLSGIVKILFSALTKSVMFAMIGSYFTAMTIIPLFASKVLASKEQQKGLPHFFVMMENLVHRLNGAYSNSLHLALNNGKKILFGLVMVLVTLAVCLAPRIGKELFPRADAGNLTLEMRFATGTKIEKTAEIAAKVDTQLRKWIEPSDLKMIITNAGVTYGFPAAFTPNTGTQDVFFNIELTEDRKKSSQEYAKLIREELPKSFPNTTYNIELGGLLSAALNGGLPSPIDIQIEGPKLENSHRIATEIASKLRELKGAVQVRVQQRLDSPQIQIDLNRRRSMALGINTEEVVKNVVSAVNGSATFSPTIWVDPASGIDYLLGVQFQENQVCSLDQLKSIPITGRAQDRGVPLSQIADVTEIKGPSEINHVNLKSVVDIYLDAQDRDIGSLSHDVAQIIKAYPMPENYSADIRGEISEMNKSVGSLGGGFLLAAVLVYLILVVQFKSFGIPLIIMITVPMGMVGIILMLFLTKTYFSIQAAIGAIFMIGIAVANGVLLIEFILHKAAHEGMNDHSIVSGAKARLRPILMTSLASVLGLVPMAIGLGHGAEANIPLGRSVIGGQLLSVTLTLFVVPILVKLFLVKKSISKNEKLKMVSPIVGCLLFFISAALMMKSANAEQIHHVLTSKEVIEKIMEYSPELRAKKLETMAAEEQIDVQRAGYFPKIDFEATDSTGFPGSSGQLGIGGLMGSSYRSGLGVGFLIEGRIFDFGRTKSKLELAKAEFETKKVDADLTTEQVKRVALLHLIECAHWVSLSESWNELVQESLLVEREVKQFIKTGQRSIVEQYLVDSQIEEANTQVADYQSRVKDEMQTLSILLGDKDEFVCPNIDQIEILADEWPIESVPLYRKVQKQYLLSQQKVSAAKSDYLPELIGIASFGSEERSRVVPTQDYALGVGLKIPLFEGFKTTHEVHEAEAKMEAAEEDLNATRDQVILMNRQIDRKIRTQSIKLDHLKTEMALAHDGFKVAKQRYFSFEGKLIDLRESLRNLSRVLTQRIDARFEIERLKIEKQVMNGRI